MHSILLNLQELCEKKAKGVESTVEFTVNRTSERDEGPLSTVGAYAHYPKDDIEQDGEIGKEIPLTSVAHWKPLQYRGKIENLFSF
ncbi:Hypothetical predicted protein [Podarcis lilfordi]|uniref:Uncharacterized protein n=1 Tax=Podarcis lilfordi TaxID=74358 RepID=A0AA35JTW0_9SAUR|nr:Hypothetical predicted protein [Podarcis lilfordi]